MPYKQLGAIGNVSELQSLHCKKVWQMGLLIAYQYARIKQGLHTLAGQFNIAYSSFV